MIDKYGNTLFPRGTDKARVIKVIETKAARGNGVQNQPCRIVTQYWSLSGDFLAELDPAEDMMQCE